MCLEDKAILLRGAVPCGVLGRLEASMVGADNRDFRFPSTELRLCWDRHIAIDQFSKFDVHVERPPFGAFVD